MCIIVAAAAPGLDYGLHSPAFLKAAPVFPEPVFSAPILPSPVIKTYSAPILPAPVIKTYSSSIFPAPVLPQPIIKAPVFAPAPIFKAVAPVPVAPATSYATITQFVAHPAPVVKVT